jgi:hypothetical protein
MPAHNTMYIEKGALDIKEMTLFNSMGQVMNKYQNPNEVNEINRENLPSGTYYLHISTNQGSVTKPVIFME